MHTLGQRTLAASGTASNLCRHVSVGRKLTEIAYQQGSPVFEQAHPCCAFVFLWECTVPGGRRRAKFSTFCKNLINSCCCFFFSFDLILKSSWLQLKLAGPRHFTFVSNKAFSRFFSLSWAEALAVALPSWDLILCSSSSSFSRSLSKVWAQLSHSARQIKLT